MLRGHIHNSVPGERALNSRERTCCHIYISRGYTERFIGPSKRIICINAPEVGANTAHARMEGLPKTYYPRLLARTRRRPELAPQGWKLRDEGRVAREEPRPTRFTQASPEGIFSTPRSPRAASLVRVHPPLLPTRCCVRESLATDCAALMHIKYVVVEGFRVYRDRIELAPLSPKHNVVGEPPDPPRSTPRAPYATAHPELPCYAVGANGAGKSNLFNGACRRRA